MDDVVRLIRGYGRHGFLDIFLRYRYVLTPMDIDKLKRLFAEKYGVLPVGVVCAPGRVNLIGEHTDYNDGFVLPIAIERKTCAAFAPRDGRTIRISSLQQEGRDASIGLDRAIEKGDPAWSNYPRGVAAGLVVKGVGLVGMDILFDSDVPIGGGLSSSASLEVAGALAMLKAADATMDDYELALLCQKAEHDFAGAPCGIMDQAISVMARAGKAMLLDCRDGGIKQVKFDDSGIVVLVADTQVKHDLTDGGYAARREQCHAAADKMGVEMLRDADEKMFRDAAEGLTQKELMRARHVVSEIARTLQAVDALDAGDYVGFGKLMYASHASLRDDFEVSCDELDAIVNLAQPCEGVYGARMTGGGFGGCAIILARTDQADAIGRAVREGFAERFGRSCPIFPTHAAQGAGDIE